jgi:hypothetical protein
VVQEELRQVAAGVGFLEPAASAISQLMNLSSPSQQELAELRVHFTQVIKSIHTLLETQKSIHAIVPPESFVRMHAALVHVVPEFLEGLAPIAVTVREAVEGRLSAGEHTLNIALSSPSMGIVRAETNSAIQKRQAATSKCFIATATYGDELHPDVVELRRFRDSHLVRTKAGRLFIAMYYRCAPVFADFLVRVPVAKVLSRMVLSPVVRGVRILNDDCSWRLRRSRHARRK